MNSIDKWNVGSVALICLLSTPIQAEIQYQASFEPRFYEWEGSNGKHGYQIVNPVTVNLHHQNNDWAIDGAARVAYIKSKNQTPSASGKVSGYSDTALSATFTKSSNRFSHWYSLDLNLPTGEQTLYGEEKYALMDGNLVEQTRFGEGLNFSPAFGLNYYLSEFDTLGFSASYTVKRDYIPDGDTQIEFDPGDILTTTLQYQRVTNKYLFSSSLAVTHESTSTFADIGYYRPGDRVDLYLSAAYMFTPQHTTQGYIRYTVVGRNAVYNGFTRTLEKQDASNGDSYMLGVSHSYRHNQKLTLGGGLEYLVRNDNDIELENDIYIPGRKKLTLSLDARYELNPQQSISARMSYFDMNDSATAFLPEQDFHGSSLFVTFTNKF